MTSASPSSSQSQNAAPTLHFVNPFSSFGPCSPICGAMSVKVPLPLLR